MCCACLLWVLYIGWAVPYTHTHTHTNSDFSFWRVVHEHSWGKIYVIWWIYFRMVSIKTGSEHSGGGCNGSHGGRCFPNHFSALTLCSEGDLLFNCMWILFGNQMGQHDSAAGSKVKVLCVVSFHQGWKWFCKTQVVTAHCMWVSGTYIFPAMCFLVFLVVWQLPSSCYTVGTCQFQVWIHVSLRLELVQGAIHWTWWCALINKRVVGTLVEKNHICMYLCVKPHGHTYVTGYEALQSFWESVKDQDWFRQHPILSSPALWSTLVSFWWRFAVFISCTHGLWTGAKLTG